MTSDALRMKALFDGYDGAFGTHGRGVANANKGGKLEIRTTARTVKEFVSEEVWAEHLSGKSPLGIFAIRRDQTCVWGAIDVDDYGLSQADIVQRVRRESLPLMACRTKSGGTHLYLFLTEPVEAQKMIDTLRRMAGVLGFGSSEIFPKQTHVLWESGDFGSWLNMPYLGGDKTERYCVNEKGKGLTLKQFLNAAEEARVAPEDMDKLANDAPRKGGGGAPGGGGDGSGPEFGDAPPCLQTLTAAKFGPGTQNEGLYAMGVLAKKKYPDKWQVKLKEWAKLYFNPPIPETDSGLIQVISGLQKKAYQYKCKGQPLVNYCNAPLCRTRRHGVGGPSGGGGMPKLSDIAVLNTDEPIWFITVDDTRVQFTTVELLNYGAFQTKVLAATHVCPPNLKRDTWVQTLQSLLPDVVVIDAPDEAGVAGQFFEILESHLTDRQRAQTKDEILLGKAWWDEDNGRVYFRLKDISEACERVRFRNMSRTAMVSRLREMGGISDGVKLKGKFVNLWSIPSEILQQQTEAHRTPDLKEQVI